MLEKIIRNRTWNHYSVPALILITLTGCGNEDKKRHQNQPPETTQPTVEDLNLEAQGEAAETPDSVNPQTRLSQVPAPTFLHTQLAVLRRQRGQGPITELEVLIAQGIVALERPQSPQEYAATLNSFNLELIRYHEEDERRRHPNHRILNNATISTVLNFLNNQRPELDAEIFRNSITHIKIENCLAGGVPVTNMGLLVNTLTLYPNLTHLVLSNCSAALSDPNILPIGAFDTWRTHFLRILELPHLTHLSLASLNPSQGIYNALISALNSNPATQLQVLSVPGWNIFRDSSDTLQTLIQALPPSCQHIRLRAEEITPSQHAELVRTRYEAMRARGIDNAPFLIDLIEPTTP